MTDKRFSLLRTHRDNITRYHRLLKTNLTEFERQFVQRRLSEERSAMGRLAASTTPAQRASSKARHFEAAHFAA